HRSAALLRHQRYYSLPLPSFLPAMRCRSPAHERGDIPHLVPDRADGVVHDLAQLVEGGFLDGLLVLHYGPAVRRLDDVVHGPARRLARRRAAHLGTLVRHLRAVENRASHDSPPVAT